VLNVEHTEGPQCHEERHNTGQVAGSSGNAWLIYFHPWIFPLLSSLLSAIFLVWGLEGMVVWFIKTQLTVLATFGAC